MSDEGKVRDKVDKTLEKKGGYPGADPGDDKAPPPPPPPPPPPSEPSASDDEK